MFRSGRTGELRVSRSLGTHSDPRGPSATTKRREHDEQRRGDDGAHRCAVVRRPGGGPPERAPGAEPARDHLIGQLARGARSSAAVHSTWSPDRLRSEAAPGPRTSASTLSQPEEASAGSALLRHGDARAGAGGDATARRRLTVPYGREAGTSTRSPRRSWRGGTSRAGGRRS